MRPPLTAPLVFCVSISAGSLAYSQSLAVTSTISQTVDTSPAGTAAIPGSGTKSNTATWSAGEVGRFILKSTGGETYGMIVSATSPTGVLSAGTDSLMVARTVNSQGLTDNGTVSVYVNPGASSTTPGNWSLDLKFAFFNETFTSSKNLNLQLTSLDIDFDQRYYTQDADFNSNFLYAGSKITAAPAVAGFTGHTASGNSQFNDATHAVSSNSKFQSEFDIRVAHDNVALFMFEFRNPSSIVPEPSCLLLSGIGSLMLFRRRR